ncbi:MAG: ABC transporter permease [Synergistaceae bacterium]|jgi:ribose transport system permease protein|nr:ABC transporter permease [Synergistaceae bacterium]
MEAKVTHFNPLARILKSTPGMVFFVTIMISALVHLSTGNFYSAYNLGTLVRQVSFTIIVAFGQTLVLILGGIDLSVAGISAFCSMSFALMSTKTGINPFLCLFIAILIGGCLGTISGFVICKLDITPFIVTLATGSIYTGVVYVVTRGKPVVGIPANVARMGQGMLFDVIPYPAIAMLVICFMLIFVLKNTAFGRHIYAIGGNAIAANIVGVRINRVKIMTYAISGVLASIAGTLMVCRLASSQVNIGENWVMPSITAVILGGTSMSGGSGGVGGTIIGGLMMGVISTSIVLLGISSYWETIVTGSVVIIAVAIDAIRQKQQTR